MLVKAFPGSCTLISLETDTHEQKKYAVENSVRLYQEMNYFSLIFLQKD